MINFVYMTLSGSAQLQAKWHLQNSIKPQFRFLIVIIQLSLEAMEALLFLTALDAPILKAETKQEMMIIKQRMERLFCPLLKKEALCIKKKSFQNSISRSHRRASAMPALLKTLKNLELADPLPMHRSFKCWKKEDMLEKTRSALFQSIAAELSLLF